MLQGAIPGAHPSHDGARVPAPGARGRLPVELTADVLRGRHATPILWSLFWGGRSFYQLLRDLDGIGPKGLEAELAELERKSVVRRERSATGGRRLYALTRSGERLKLVLGLMHEWGLLALTERERAGERDVGKQPGSVETEESDVVASGPFGL